MESDNEDIFHDCNSSTDNTNLPMDYNNQSKDNNNDQILCNKVNKTSSVINYLGVKVINLSNVSLTDSQLRVLEKGITFVPTPDKIDLGEIHYDVSRFLRRIKLKVHFYDDREANSQVENQNDFFNQVPPALFKFKPKSNWVPPNQNPTVSAFCDNVKRDLLKISPNSADKFNLTNEEFRALSDLKKNPDIIIKKADKGSSIVVMNKGDYINEGLRQLSDNRYYIETEGDLSKKHHNEVQKLLNRFESSGDIDKELLKCLKTNEVKTASFYLLPKIHKVKEAGKFPPGRPIISANGCPTERISAFVDENIKGAVPDLKSHIKDTTDFIHKIENLNIPNNAILVTFDVVSLYTNIPNDEGIKAVAKSLRKYPPPHTEPRVILQLLKEVLFKNNFEFNGKHYLQIGGTAMGTKLAPSYANIFMGNLEEEILSKCRTKPFFWVRFIDDIFAIWTEGELSLHQFLEFINTQHHSIKFTMEKSTEKVVFLDTWVQINGNKLEVELYSKPTDTHNYLHFSSYHQSHTKRGGPYGQFLRVRRNCTNDTDYDHHSKIMKNHYIKRGYPSKHVEDARKQALNKQRKDLLDPGRLKDQKHKNIVPLVLTHHPSNAQIQEIIMRHWGILQFSDKCKKALPEKPLFTTRRGRNIRDILIKAKLNNDDGPAKALPKCKKADCLICKEVQKSEVVSSISLVTHRTPTQCTCKTLNVIYLLTCSVCQKQYVGETKRAFYIRYKEHCKDVEFNRDKPIPNHVLTHGEHRTTLIPQILEVIKKNPDLENTTIYRRKREAHWIYTLNTMAPAGLNTLG